MTKKIRCLGTCLALLMGVFAYAGNPPLVQTQKNLTTYAAEDFRIYKKTGATGATWDAFVQEGFEALDKQDLTSAIEFMRKAVNLGCQSGLVYFKLALAYEATGSYYSAVQYYELARNQFAKDKIEHRYQKQLNENMGRALYLLGKKDDAMPYLIEAIKNADYPWALRIAASYYLEKGDLASATACYERYLQAPGSNLTPAETIEIYLLLARSYRNQNDAETAKKYYRQITLLDATNREALDYIRKQETDAGKSNTIEKAFEIFEKH